MLSSVFRQEQSGKGQYGASAGHYGDTFMQDEGGCNDRDDRNQIYANTAQG